MNCQIMPNPYILPALGHLPRVVGHHPVSVLVHGQGLNISVFGFDDRLCWGLLADPALVPDLPHLADLVSEELILLRAASAG